MKLELQQFPLERLYFLESKEFLDKEEKIFLKQNSSFKLNSYYLGMSKRKINNDKMLYLFNGLRGYYEVNSRFVKNPKIMEIRPPMSKLMYKLFFKRRKYKYQDLIIYSLKLFSRPTITLTSDKDSGELYQFPYKLLEFLNENRVRFLIKKNYNFWKKDNKTNFKHLKLKMFIRLNRFNKKSYRRLKFMEAYILGFITKLTYLNSDLLNSKLAQKRLLFKNVFSVGTNKNKKIKKRISFYKTLKTVQSWLVRRSKPKTKFGLTRNPVMKQLFVTGKKRVFFFTHQKIKLKNKIRIEKKNKKKKIKKKILKTYKSKKFGLLKLIIALKKKRLSRFSLKGVCRVITKARKNNVK